MVAGGGETAPLLGNESPAQLKQIKHDAMLGAVFAFGYMVISIGLTLYNKWVMPDFKFPFCYFMLQQGVSFAILSGALAAGLVETKATFKWGSSVGLGVLLIAALFTAGLVFDLGSLAYITASLNQVMKAVAPILVMGMSMVIEEKRYPWQQYATASVIVVGIILTAFKNPGGNGLGVALCIGCICCMVVQISLSGKVLSGAVKGPVEFMLYISGPSAAIALPFFLATELKPVLAFMAETDPMTGALLHGTWGTRAVQLLGGSFVALSLNLCKMATIRYGSSAFAAICGNVKVALVVIMATVLFGDQLNLMNTIGLVIATIGFLLHTQAMQRYKTTTKADRVAAAEAPTEKEQPVLAAPAPVSSVAAA